MGLPSTARTISMAGDSSWGGLTPSWPARRERALTPVKQSIPRVWECLLSIPWTSHNAYSCGALRSGVASFPSAAAPNLGFPQTADPLGLLASHAGRAGKPGIPGDFNGQPVDFI